MSKKKKPGFSNIDQVSSMPELPMRIGPVVHSTPFIRLYIDRLAIEYSSRAGKMPKVKATVKIENVVASATLNQRVDLNAVVKGYPGVEYRPEQFPGLVFRLKRPKTATLIFNSGKMVCTGAKSEKEARRAVMRVIKELKKSGIIIISKPELKIQNIVASANLGGMIDLEKSTYDLGKTMYEPEQFPGLIYRMSEPKVVILLFASGKLVCTGAKREQDVYDAVHKLHGVLEEQELIFYE